MTESSNNESDPGHYVFTRPSMEPTGLELERFIKGDASMSDEPDATAREGTNPADKPPTPKQDPDLS